MSFRRDRFGRSVGLIVGVCFALAAPAGLAAANNSGQTASWLAIVNPAPAPATAQPKSADAVPQRPAAASRPASWTTVVQAAPAPGPAAAPRAGVAPTAPSLAQAQPVANDANDPLEPLNRAIFGFNEFMYGLVIRPLAEFYVLVLPQDARDGVRNFLDNVRTPVILANDLLQGEGTRAWNTTRRFFINSTVGVGGVIDVAKRWGIEGHDEDLGQTFAVWGVPEPFYLVLPILGPSNPRDAVGKFLDSYLDPVSHWADNTDRDEITWSRTVVSGIDSYSRVMDELRKLKETSIDYYAAVRSISRQKRAADIRNGAPADVPLPDIRYDFNAELTTR